MRTLSPVVLLLTIQLAGCGPAAHDPAPPVAKIEPVVFEEFGHTRTDDYYWLREREDPEVTAYLEAENAYADAVTAPWADLRETLYQEIVGRIQPDDDSVPVREGGWWYSRRYEEGREYPVYVRRADVPDAPEQVMLDVNLLAAGHGFFQVSGADVSSDGHVLAWAEDAVGRRIYTVRFKDLRTGEMLPDVLEDATPNLVWAEDGRTLFYTRKDPQTLRSYQVWRHVLGTDPAADALVFQENDETFNVGLDKTMSRRWVLIESDQTLSTETLVIDAQHPEGEPRVLLPRERDHEHAVDHLDGHWYIRTNKDARNFRLVRAPEADPSAWEDVVPHRDDVLFMRAVLFHDWIAVLERRDGLRRLRVIDRATGVSREIDLGETAYAIWTADNREPDSHLLRLGYESMTTPESTYDYDMRTGETTLLKRDVVVGDFDPARYVTERLMIPARDGALVPVSLVRRTDTPVDGTAPLLLYGYGSYGASMEPSFSSARLSLLDRGFTYAIAHIRGGEEMGRRWYDDGKLLKKMNTFTDFIDCGRALVAQGYAAPARLSCLGGSAGGLLVGAVVNMAPDLFHAAVAQVPFVDVVTTMLDETIPLTTFEYDEWGNPNERESYEYMLGYSPYDNVTAQEYPHLLIMTGLHDSQVQYWEPAKWTAKLRALKTDDHLLLFQTNMEAGHGGASGRFRRHQETALMYAFLLKMAGVE
ncbi:MAG TPA: S9 family peptidase [Candidatus Krumholzibacteria bacterium]|nr:S9 family peptidase [Candidatus Krumholzibacteria bacterium]